MSASAAAIGDWQEPQHQSGDAEPSDKEILAKGRPDADQAEADDEPRDPAVSVTVGQMTFRFDLTAVGVAVSCGVPNESGGLVISISPRHGRKPAIHAADKGTARANQLKKESK